MITAAIAVTILVALTILVHYEVLRVASVLIPEERHVLPRFRVVLVVFACFAAHTIEVWLFALAYYLFVDVFGLGSFGGAHGGTVRQRHARRAADGRAQRVGLQRRRAGDGGMEGA